jgi:hypothetical protein
MQLFEALVATTKWLASGELGTAMSKNAERHKSALYQVEGLVLDCITGFSDDSKTVKQVIADIYAVGEKIKAEGDPYMIAAFDEIVGRSKGVWETINSEPPDNGTA